ncbi:MAG: tetratricopeptide repeat protein [Acidobacteriaceae bacterium]
MIGLLAWTFRDGLCAPATPACTKPPAIASRLQAHPDAQTWIELGNWFGDHRQFECAQQAFRSGLRLDPNSPQLNYLLALGLYESQDFKDAVAPLQRSIHTDSAVLNPHLLLASIYARLDQPVDAETEWRAALHIDPASTLALHGLSQSLIARKAWTDEIILLHDVKLDEDLAIDLAIAYSQDGQLVDAVVTAEKALQSYPNSIKLSNALVALYTKVSRTFDAEHLAEKTYQAHPDDIAVQTSYLRTLVINGDWGPAKPVSAQLMAEAPHAYDTLYLNGVMERQAGDFAAARDHLTEAAALRPGQQSVESNLGIALSRLHDLTDAKVHLEKALELGNTEPETRFELANVLRALGQTDEAKQEMLRYQQAVKDSNNASLAVSKAAEAAQALAKGDAQRAVQLYREAFDATPGNALIGYRLSTALDQAGDLDGEQSVLEKIIAIDPTIALAQNQLGYLESRRGNYASAESHFRQAVASAPAFTQAWISLAATLGMESKFPEAQQAAASALRLDPQNSEAQQLSHDLTAAQSQQPHN